VVSQAVRRRRGNLRLTGGALACLLLLSLLVGSISAHHTHGGPGDALYNDACLDLRLAMNTDRGGLWPPSPLDIDGPLPTSDSLSVVPAFGIPDARPMPSVARAPPRPA
jgi:hypothetical protein